MPVLLQTRRSFCTVFLLLVLAGLWALGTDRARAQERQEHRPHSLHAGAWALQFGIGENFTLDSFLGSTISGKRHVSAARAWQVGLTLDASVRSSDTENDSRTDDRETLTLTARYLAHPLLGAQELETVQLYLGAGPQLSFQRDSRQGQESQTSTTWGIGLSGTIGAEWFVHRRISLSGAYETALLYRREHAEIERPGEDEERTTNRYSLEAGGVRFGVSVYF